MMSSARPIFGIVPAAGRATRLPNRAGSKELLPVGDVAHAGGRRLRAISEHLVDAMVDAGAERIYIVVAPDKRDIVEFYGRGERHGVAIEYVYQHDPTGMSDAIDLAFEPLRQATVLMGMPDTIVRPVSSLRMVRELLDRTGCDVALAVSPTDEPWRLGPVRVDAEGRVLEIMDKPPMAPHNRVWTVACWSPRFTGFLHRHLRQQPRVVAEAPLGLIMQAALEQDFAVRAMVFADGRYVDAGTIDGLAAARRLVDAEAAVR
jgi:glucose-1-phosphate thymidylyltransferase